MSLADHTTSIYGSMVTIVAEETLKSVDQTTTLLPT